MTVDSLYLESCPMCAESRHQTLDKAVSNLADLQAYPWILPPPGSSLRRTVNGLFAEADLPLPANVIESLSVLTNVALMQDQKTVGLLPMETARQLSGQGGIRSFTFGTPLRFGGIGCFYLPKPEPRASVKLFRACNRLDFGRHVIND